jgi:hypothetical protein
VRSSRVRSPDEPALAPSSIQPLFACQKLHFVSIGASRQRLEFFVARQGGGERGLQIRPHSTLGRERFFKARPAGEKEAFKRALLNAKSIALADPAAGGPVGIYATALIERLGISAELKPKIKLIGGGVAPVEPVVKGDAEIGLTTISEIIQSQPAIEMVGPLPPEIQTFLVFTAAIPRNAKESTAAKALLDFFISPRAISILKAKGLEPG